MENILKIFRKKNQNLKKIEIKTICFTKEQIERFKNNNIDTYNDDNNVNNNNTLHSRGLVPSFNSENHGRK